MFKIKGGNSDIAWENEMDPIDIPPPDGGDPDPGDDPGDDWGDDPWDNEWDEDWDEDWGGGYDLGDTNPPPDEDEQENTFPDEICFTALNNAYPPPDSNGNPAHPSNASYAHNQCAIRLGAALMEAYDVKFDSASKYKGNVTHEGYPRGAKDLADMLIANGLENTGEISLTSFMNSDLYNQPGIIYQIAEDGSMAHIDVYRGGGILVRDFILMKKLYFSL